MLPTDEHHRHSRRSDGLGVYFSWYFSRKETSLHVFLPCVSVCNPLLYSEFLYIRELHKYVFAI